MFFFVTRLTGLHGVTVYSSTKIRGQTPSTTHLTSDMLDSPGWPMKPIQSDSYETAGLFRGSLLWITELHTVSNSHTAAASAATQTAVQSNICFNQICFTEISATEHDTNEIQHKKTAAGHLFEFDTPHTKSADRHINICWSPKLD